MPNKKIKNDELYNAAFQDGKISILNIFNSKDMLNSLQERINFSIKEKLYNISFEKDYIKTLKENSFKNKKEYEKQIKFFINIIKKYEQELKSLKFSQNFIKKLQHIHNTTYF